MNNGRGLIHACVADRLEQYDQIAATQNYEADSKTSWPACKRIKGEASVKTFMSALGTLNLLKRCVVDCNFFKTPGQVNGYSYKR